MMKRRLALLALSAAISLGCGGEQDQLPQTPTEPPSCPDPLEIALPDGSCFRPGIPEGSCADGFEHDGRYGCEPILPADPCPPGLMAVPGDHTCRPVMDCGQGKWGDLPVDATTQYVDGAYAGLDSDGTEAKPWPTIGEAHAAAEPGALIAVAEGIYGEDVFIDDKPVWLWGVCPERVSIVATGEIVGGICDPSAVCILGSVTGGTEVGGLTLTGAGIGVLMSGNENVLIDRVRVLGAVRGIRAEGTLGPTSCNVRGSLIEQSGIYGLSVHSADVVIDGSVVRTASPATYALDFGRGINVTTDCFATPTGPVCPAEARATVTVRGSLIEDNHDVGLYVSSAHATVEASVLRATLPRVSDQGGGRGIAVGSVCAETPIGLRCDPHRASVTIYGSLIEDNYGGLFVSGAEATLDASVLRGSLPWPLDQTGGRGINAQTGCELTSTGAACDPAARSAITVQRSLIENNHDIGIFVGGSDAIIETSVVRATLPRASDQEIGRGILIQLACYVDATGQHCDATLPGNAIVRSSLIEDNHDVGLLIGGGDAIVDASVIRTTAPRASDGLFGDGIVVATVAAPTSATITRTRIEDSARAGLAIFGSSVSLGDSRIRCSAFALNGELFNESAFSVTDLGGNRCGCPLADTDCQLLSSGLEPPAGLGSP